MLERDSGTLTRARKVALCPVPVAARYSVAMLEPLLERTKHRWALVATLARYWTSTAMLAPGVLSDRAPVPDVQRGFSRVYSGTTR